MPWCIGLNDNFRDEAQFYLLLRRKLTHADHCRGRKKRETEILSNALMSDLCEKNRLPLN